MKLSEMNKDEQKKFKKRLGLPLKRKIAYYDGKEKKEVIDLEEEFTFSSGACILKVVLSDGSDVLPIHSEYLKSMQDSKFLEKKETE